MDREERVADVVGEWQERRGRGDDVEAPEEIVGRHPDLADELRDAFAALRLLEGEPAGPPAEPESAPPVEAPGEGPIRRIGDFHILREIGRGGMGVVFAAEQISMRRPVALKVLYPSVTTSSKAVERFRREAQATGRLHHTNIVQVHAMGSEAGQWYYAMEHVRGRALSEVVADLRRFRGRPTPRDPTPSVGSSALASTGRHEEYARVAKMFAGVADALATAHDAGVIHRDVKPANLMLDDDGTLKILDFGLASIQSEPRGVTVTGDIMGTPGYMSPEQARTRPVDGRTDVYSLGATLYEALTLEPPLRGGDVAETLRLVLTQEPVRPRRLEPRIPRDLETIVLKALEKERAKRYASAADMARDLRAFAEGFTIAARRVTALGRAWRHARRHPARTALAVALGVAASAAAILAANTSSMSAQRDRATSKILDLDYRSLLLPILTGDPGGRAFERATRLAPERPDAWFARAMRGLGLSQAMDSLRDRLADLDAAKARGLLEARYRLGRGALLRRVYRPEEARVEEALVADAGSVDAVVVVLRARIAASDGRSQEAERALDSVLRGTRSDDLVAWAARLTRADVRARREGYEEAIADLLALRPNALTEAPLPVLDAEIARLWRRLGRPEAGDRHVEATLASYEPSTETSPYEDLARALDIRGMHVARSRALEIGLARHPEDPRLLVARLQWLPFEDRGREAARLLTMQLEPALAQRVRYLRARDLNDENPAEALTELDALRLDPDAPTGFFITRAQALYRMGRYAEAEAEHRARLRRDPESEDLNVDLAHLLCARYRPAEALVVIDDFLKFDRSRWRLYDVRVLALMLMDRDDEAVGAARKAIELSTSEDLSPYPETAMGAVNSFDFLSMRHPLEVLPQVRRFLAEHPEDSWARVALVRALVAQGDLDGALAAFDHPTPLAPSTVVEQTRLMLTELRLNSATDPESRMARANELLEAARIALLRLPLGPGGLYARALALQVLLRYAEAVPVLDRYLEVVATPALGTIPMGDSPTNFIEREAPARVAWARYALVFSLIRSNQGARGLEEADRALSRADTPPSVRTILMRERARALSLLGRHAEAITTAREAIALDPKAPDGQGALGFVLLQSGDYVGSEASFLTVRDLAPEWLWQHASLLLQLDRLKEAVEENERAMAAGVTGAASNASLSVSLDGAATVDDAARAMALARKALESGQSPVGSWLAIGMANALAGDWDAAVEALRKALALEGAENTTTRVFLAVVQARKGDLPAARAALLEAKSRAGWARIPPLEKRLAAEVEARLAAGPK